ncbi:hypothetical protein BKA70DRAFT_1419717 [Coprinopsis sp. MPI-PUGE-AT-0042]|nr:hypothetical protein BKA70DRAFT_1419717 [Coprinopsis sp. MPI-PUGE-AT-0042]
MARTIDMILIGTHSPVLITIPDDAQTFDEFSSGSLEVVKVPFCGNLPGPWVGKHFQSRVDLEKELPILEILDQVVACTPVGSQEHWIPMRFVPGKPLGDTDEWSRAEELPHDKGQEWLLQKREQAAQEVVRVYKVLKAGHADTPIHGDLKSVHILWTHDPSTSGDRPHLIDWGRAYAHNQLVFFMKLRQQPVVPPEEKDFEEQNVLAYARYMTKGMYKFKE